MSDAIARWSDEVRWVANRFEIAEAGIIFEVNVWEEEGERILDTWDMTQGINESKDKIDVYSNGPEDRHSEEEEVM